MAFSRSINTILLVFTISLFDLLKNAFALSTALDLIERHASSDWKAAEEKGKQLSCAMRATNAKSAKCFSIITNARSEFTSFNDLYKWGWREDDRKDWGESSELSDDLLSLVFVQATGAAFLNLYGAAGGIIIAESSRSPSSHNQKPPVKHLTKLRVWSNVTFLEWQNQCQRKGKPVKWLKYVIRDKIMNPISRTIIREALGEPEDFSDWKKYQKGHDIDSSEKMDAIIGTPNGSGVAWMLFQHKAQLGLKKISNITIIGIDVASRPLDAIYYNDLCGCSAWLPRHIA